MKLCHYLTLSNEISVSFFISLFKAANIDFCEADKITASILIDLWASLWQAGHKQIRLNASLFA